MAKYEIIGGSPLNGEITVSGAKNAALAILPAALLVQGKCRVENVPDISDVRVLLDILADIGAVITKEEPGVVVLDCTNITKTNPEAHYIQINYNLREEFYRAKKWSGKDCIPYTVFTGAGTYPLKGLHKLVDALAIVKERYPQVKLQVPGNHIHYQESSGYERYLHRKIKKLNLSEQVEFLGRKSAEEMAQCLQKANVYAFPSAYDTDSLSLCEAQMIGTPIVASRTGGSPYLVEDGHSGFCYDYEDHHKLAELICRLFEDQALCRQISENEIRQAEQRHAREENVQKLMQTYQQLLENHKN